MQRRLARFFGDERGRSPPWLQKALGASFWSIWACYDGVLKRTLGDGERTIGNDDDDEEEEEEDDDVKGSK